MVDVMSLKPGEQPEENEDWLLVTKDSSGRYYIEGGATLGDRAGKLMSATTMNRQDAIRHATKWAEENEVSVVYVRD